MEHGQSPKLVIGVVGGIGSGKSTVARALTLHGGTLIEADAIGHASLHTPEVERRIRELWGERVLGPNGEIDRKKLGAIVFQSPVERARLEHLVHPWIGRRIRDEIERLRGDRGTGFIVLDAAIMLEAGWDQVCDKVVYVHAPRALRLQRVAAQRGWSEEELLRREVAQLPLTAKATMADRAIINAGSPEAIERQVALLADEWKLGGRRDSGLVV